MALRLFQPVEVKDLNGSSADTVVTTSGSATRRKLSLITVFNTSTSKATVKLFESSDDTSASGKQVDEIPLAPKQAMPSMFSGHTLSYSHRLIAVCDSASDGDVTIKVTYEEQDQAS